MPMWYVGRSILTPYKPAFERVREAVRFLHVTQQVPLARFSTPRNGRQRHMFLGVEGPTRDCAVTFLDSICRIARSIARSEGQEVEFGDHLLPVNPNCIPVTVDPRIWHFTRGVYAEGDPQGAKQCSWRVPPSLPKQEENAGDPLGAPEADTSPLQAEEVDSVELLQAVPRLTFQLDAEQQERHQRLLVWLSAAGQGSWETFARVSKQLGTSTDVITARRVMRRLVLLGHVERAPGGRTWSATPAALVQLATDPTRAFWCGQRSEPLRHRLGQLWAMAAPEPQAGSHGPPRWLVKSGKVRDPGVVLKARGLPLRWEGTAAENLVQRLPALDRWRDSLLREERLTMPERAERWHAGAYRDEVGFHVVDGCPQGPTGLYRLFYGNDKSAFELTGFVDADCGEFLRGDWYGLRFLAARRTGIPCPARWLTHEGRSVLLLPLSRRWPLLYERALVLASGLLPMHDSGRLCYFDVPLDIASTLAKLLGVTLQ
jgi:hypothetical protein